MVKCPNCKSEVTRSEKKWNYGPFEVRAYLCARCTATFREYTKDGKLSFVLKRGKKGNYKKA